MADIYMVYASEDRGLAEKLYGHLEQQWDVWWDDEIVGPFALAIEDQIPKSKCMVMLLSDLSRVKDTVLDELRLAKEHGLAILIARLDHCKAPYLYGGYSCCDMVDWNGEDDHPGFKQLQRRIASVAPPKTHPKRLRQIANGRLALPKLFYSVSSYNTSIKPCEAVQALRILQAPSILVSAYDLVSRKSKSMIPELKKDQNSKLELEKMISELKKYQQEGGIILLDSGNYEASRLEDESWSVDAFKKALANTPHDYVFCFDNMNQNIGKKKAIDQIVESVRRDQKLTTSPVLPVVHAPELKKGGYRLEDIPYIFSEVSKALQPPLIAIPERELGGGIIARAKMVRNIRNELNKLPYYQPVHILGTGHPWAIAIFVAAGADSFDGLEWCRYTFDEARGGISHFHLFDLFGDLEESKMGFSANVAVHNLKFLKEFENLMHGYLAENKVELWVSYIINDKEIFSKLKAQFSEIFE